MPLDNCHCSLNGARGAHIRLMIIHNVLPGIFNPAKIILLKHFAESLFVSCQCQSFCFDNHLKHVISGFMPNLVSPGTNVEH